MVIIFVPDPNKADGVSGGGGSSGSSSSNVDQVARDRATTALVTAWTGTAAASLATIDASSALVVATAGSSTALTALNTAWTGTAVAATGSDTAWSASVTATSGSNLAWAAAQTPSFATGGTMTGNLVVPSVNESVGSYSYWNSEFYSSVGTRFFSFAGPAYQQVTVNGAFDVRTKDHKTGAEIDVLLQPDGTTHSLAFKGSEIYWFGTLFPSQIDARPIKLNLVCVADSPPVIYGEAKTFVAMTSTDPVSNWVVRVIVNGGALPSGNTQAAMRVFYNGLVSDGLLSMFHTMSCMVPDSIQACLTPLIATKGLDPWVNPGIAFTGTNLSANGLIGTLGRWVDTGIVASRDFAVGDFGVTICNYGAEGSGETNRDFGQTSGYVNPIAVTSISNTAYWDFTTGAAPAYSRISGAQVGWAGYLHACYGAPAHYAKVYRANIATPHEQFLTGGAYTDGVLPAGNMAFFGAYDGAGITFPNSKRFSFCAIGRALSAAQSAQLYARIVVLRTALGGGVS